MASLVRTEPLCLLLAFTLSVAPTCPLLAQQKWEVQPKPIFDVSGIAADGSVQFEHPIAASRTSTGQVLVADAGPSSIRVFDASGRLLRTVGRAGNGPREFPRIARAASCGDSLIVWDPSRTSLVGPTGEVARTVTVPNGSGPSMGPVFRCSIGADIAYLPAAMSWVQGTPGMFVNRTVLVWADRNGRIRWQSDSLPGGEWLLARPGGYQRPLGTTLYLAFVGSTLAVAPSDSSRVWLFTHDGKRNVIQIPASSRRAPTEAEYVVAAKQIADEAPPTFRQNTEKNLLLYPVPSISPAFHGIWGDSEGCLWIRMSPAGSATTDLAVVSPGRGVISRVSIPRDVKIQEIGKDHITAIYEDDTDVHVVVLRLVRR